MKNLFLLLFISSYLLSCESIATLDEEASSKSATTFHHRFRGLPENSANAFDEIGMVHAALFSSYYEQHERPATFDSIVALVTLNAMNHPYFTAFPNLDYGTLSTQELQYIIADPQAGFAGAMNDSPLSYFASVRFEVFIDALFLKLHNEEQYELIYDTIVAYEATVITDTTYTYAEKEFILTITSIARHCIHAKEKRPKKNTDQDWDWLTTCIVGSTVGATYSAPISVLTALQTGIGTD